MFEVVADRLASWSAFSFPILPLCPGIHWIDSRVDRAISRASRFVLISACLWRDVRLTMLVIESQKVLITTNCFVSTDDANDQAQLRAIVSAS